MRRRQVLASLSGGMLLSAGCAGDLTGPRNVETSPTGSPTRTPDEGLAPCPRVPDSLRDVVPPWPDKPDVLTRERVERFATRFEEAFAARLAIPKAVSGVESVAVRASPKDGGVSRTDDGWLVHLWVGEPVVDYGTPTNSPHYDPGMYAASYHVSDETVLRARGPPHVDPRRNGAEYPGEPVECPPGAWES